MGIYKQEGMYHASVMVGGVRYRKALGVRTKNEAEKEYRQFRDQIDAGLISAHPTRLQRLTFGEVLQQWLEDRRRGVGRLDKPALSPKTLTTEAERAVIVGRHLGHLKIASMPPGAIEEYINRRRGEGTSNGTVNRELDVIRGTLRKADRKHLAAMCRNLPAAESIGRAFSPEEKARLIAAASRTPGRRTARQALVLALNTSLRPVEMKNLRWKDVDLEERAVTLRISKTKAGRRSIPLNDAALEVFEELEEARKFVDGELADQDSFVFFSGDPGRPVGSWRTAWRSILRESGIQPARFYDCRHTVVTELLQDPDTSEATVKSIVGHVSRKMLERYSHQRMAPKRAAVQAPTFGTQNLTVPVNTPAGKPN